MATTEDVTIGTDTNEVRTANLTVQDAELAAYLGDASEEERTDRAARAFQVGAMTLQLAETSTDLEYGKREFERMRGDLEDVREEREERFDDDGDRPRPLERYLGDEGGLRSHLDGAFGEEGDFVERPDEVLGEDGERIQTALDPDVEGTPTYRLKSELMRSRPSTTRSSEGRRGKRERGRTSGSERVSKRRVGVSSKISSTKHRTTSETLAMKKGVSSVGMSATSGG